MNDRISRTRAACSALLMTLLLAACGGDKPEALLASAKDYLAKHDPKAAVIQIKNALQKDPNLGEARFLLGSALLEGRDAVSAEVELRKALELKYPADQVMPLLGKALLAQGKARRLVDDFAQTKLTQPEAQADFQTTLAFAYSELGNRDASQAAIQVALTALPGYPPAAIAQALQKAAQRDFAGAQAIADDVIAKSPNSIEAWKLKGDLSFYVQSDAAAALEAYRKALAIQPNYLLAHYGMLVVLMTQGNLEEAGKQLEQVKKVNGSAPLARYFESQLAYRQRDYKRARELAQQLLKLTPDNARALQLAGAIEFQANSLLQAETYLNKALQSAPDLGLARRLLVSTYLRSGQTSKALAALPPNLGKDYRDPDMLTVAGEAYLQAGDAKKAEEYLSLAARLDPKDAKRRTSLAMAHLLTNNGESAFGELQEIAASDTGPTADLALISAYLRRKDFDRALKAIDGLEKKQPDAPLSAYLRGQVLLAKRDEAGARKSLERAVALNPTYFPAVASLAGLDLAAKKPEDARKRFDAVLAKDPKNLQALLAIAELRGRSGGNKEEVAQLLGNAVSANPTEVTPRIQLIELHLRTKDYKQALAVAQAGVAALPENAELLDALGRAQQASGDMNQALVTYNKVASLQPLSPMPLLRLSAANVEAKDLNSAAQNLRRALEIKPDLLEAQRGLVVLNVQQQKYADALLVTSTIQKQRPKEAIGFLLEGDVLAAQKKWDSAADAYRSGLKQAAASELAVKLHAVLLPAGKDAEASRFASSWVKDHPKDVAFVFYLGDNAIIRKDYAAAERYYQTVVQSQPGNASAYNNLAWVTGQLKKSGAVALAEKANSIAPNQPIFMDTLAMLLADAKQYDRAIELEKKAVEAQPKNSAIRLNLARIYIESGDKAKAKQVLDELAALGDKFSAQAEVSRLLKSL